jgi:hypothetical protein
LPVTQNSNDTWNVAGLPQDFHFRLFTSDGWSTKMPASAARVSLRTACLSPVIPRQGRALGGPACAQLEISGGEGQGV